MGLLALVAACLLFTLLAARLATGTPNTLTHPFSSLSSPFDPSFASRSQKYQKNKSIVCKFLGGFI
jgi:hypothetical protein